MLFDGPGLTFAEGIVCPQASQTCCDNGISLPISHDMKAILICITHYLVCKTEYCWALHMLAVSYTPKAIVQKKNHEMWNILPIDIWVKCARHLHSIVRTWNLIMVSKINPNFSNKKVFSDMFNLFIKLRNNLHIHHAYDTLEANLRLIP